MSDRKNAAPGTRLGTKSYDNGLVFETFDEAIGDRHPAHQDHFELNEQIKI